MTKLKQATLAIAGGLLLSASLSAGAQAYVRVGPPHPRAASSSAPHPIAATSTSLVTIAGTAAATSGSAVSGFSPLWRSRLGPRHVAQRPRWLRLGPRPLAPLTARCESTE